MDRPSSYCAFQYDIMVWIQKQAKSVNSFGNRNSTFDNDFHTYEAKRSNSIDVYYKSKHK